MKVKYLAKFIAIITINTVLLISGCGQVNPQKELDCPFSDMDWTSTTADVFAIEGEDYSTYDSIYGGITYSYLKEYQGYDGTIKYMYNDEDKLMCVAWAYGSDNIDEILTLYNEIHATVVEQYGESGYQTDQSTNYGDVWHLEQGNIVISVMATSSNKALQYSYLNPAVSQRSTEPSE